MVWLVSYDESEGKDETCLTAIHVNKNDNDELKLDVIYTLFGDEADTMAKLLMKSKF